MYTVPPVMTDSDFLSFLCPLQTFFFNDSPYFKKVSVIEAITLAFTATALKLLSITCSVVAGTGLQAGSCFHFRGDGLVGPHFELLHWRFVEANI